MEAGDLEGQNDEDESGEALRPDERKLVTQSYDMSVATLLDQWNEKTLLIPEIQREYVWDNAKASRLIESLLLNIPIPVIYVAEAPDDTYEVIDGHQRIRSIARFVNNEFGLSGLRILNDDEHKKKEVPPTNTGRAETHQGEGHPRDHHHRGLAPLHALRDFRTVEYWFRCSEFTRDPQQYSPRSIHGRGQECTRARSKLPNVYRDIGAA